MRDGRMGEVGLMTYGLRDNAKDVYDIWIYQTSRRCEFGEREIRDIQEAYLGLGVLLRLIEKAKKKEAA